MAAARLDQVPDARGTGHRVEQVRPFRLPRRLRPGRTGTTAARRRSPAAPAARPGRSVRVTVPSKRGVHPPPCDRGTLGEERRPEDGVARRASRVRVVAARERRAGQRVELVRGEQVQRASGVVARTNDQHLAVGVHAADTVAGPVGAVVTASAHELPAPRAALAVEPSMAAAATSPNASAMTAATPAPCFTRLRNNFFISISDPLAGPGRPNND